MPAGKLKANGAMSLIWIIFMLPRLVSLRVITQDEADELIASLNENLRKVLGLKE